MLQLVHQVIHEKQMQAEKEKIWLKQIASNQSP